MAALRQLRQIKLANPESSTTSVGNSELKPSLSQDSSENASELDSSLFHVLLQQQACNHLPTGIGSLLGVTKPIAVRGTSGSFYLVSDVSHVPPTIDQDDATKYISASIEQSEAAAQLPQRMPSYMSTSSSLSRTTSLTRQSSMTSSTKRSTLQQPTKGASKAVASTSTKKGRGSGRQSTHSSEVDDDFSKLELEAEAEVDNEDLETKRNGRTKAELPGLLRCDAPKFNADAELRRRFGKRASSSTTNRDNDEEKEYGHGYGGDHPGRQRAAQLRRMAAMRAHANTGKSSLTLVNLKYLDVSVLEYIVGGNKPFSVVPVDDFEEWAQSKHTLIRSQLKAQLPCTVPIEEIIHLPPTESSQHRNYFRFIPSSHYMTMQRHYINAVNSYDPQAIADFVYRYPTHLDGLLQFANILESMGRHGPAHALVQQALALTEILLPKVFSLTHGDARLVLHVPPKSGGALTAVEKEENTLGTSLALAFLRALARNAQMLSKKAAPGAALESAKLALSLAPSDPNCLLQVMDYYALRAQKYDFITRFIAEYSWPSFGVYGPTLMDALYLQFPELKKVSSTPATLSTSHTSATPLTSRSMTIDDLNRRDGVASTETKAAETKTNTTISTIPQTGFLPAALLPNWCFSAALAQFHLENAASNNSAARLNRDESKLCAVSIGLLRGFKPTYLQELVKSLGSGSETPSNPNVPMSKTFVLDLLTAYDPAQLSTALASHPPGIPVVSPAFLPPRPDELANMGASEDAPLQVSSAQLLQRAIALFPEVIRALLTVIDSRKLSTSSWQRIADVLEKPWNTLGGEAAAKGSSQSFYAPNQWIERLVHIYAARSANMWRADASLEFLQVQAQHVVDKLKEGAWQPQGFERIRQTLFTRLPLAVRQMQRSDYTDEVASVPEELNRPQRLDMQRREFEGGIRVQAAPFGGREVVGPRPEIQEIFYDDEDEDQDEDEEDDMNVAINQDAGLLRAFVESLLPWRTAPAANPNRQTERNAAGTAEVEDDDDDDDEDEARTNPNENADGDANGR